MRDLYTEVQKEAWDKFTGPGYYQVNGAQAFTYLCHRVKKAVDNTTNPKTVLVIGSNDKREPFLQWMVEHDVIDSVAAHEPRFFLFADRQTDEWDYISKNLCSEMDAEQFRNFIATSVEKTYYPIDAVVIFDEGWTNGQPYPFLDRILEVPVYKNGAKIKTIRPAVYNVCPCDEANFYKESSDAASIDWRKDTFSLLELPDKKEKMFIEHLIPEKSLTMVPAPSYTGKTHICIEVGISLATGTDFLGHFKGPQEPVPVIYHVPELHAGLFRSFMGRLNAMERLKGREEMFLIRPLEFDLWQLDSPQMIDSSRGRYVFLDTFGYFNSGDDAASYQQAIVFAKLVNNLIREGCLGVCALYHPPKYSKNKRETGNVMTLENQILGSAGYGGVLRSCLAMRNLHEDSNTGLWVYVQGLKNPGLGGPFQIEGTPLRLVKKPGESPYLAELLKGSSKKEKALTMVRSGQKRDEICKELHISPNKLSEWKKEMEFDFAQGEEGND